MTAVSDDFNRTDNSTSLGANWTNRFQNLGILNNAAYTPQNGWSGASYNTPLNTNDQEVSVIVGVLGASAEYTALALGANSAGQCMLGYFTNTGSTVYLYSIETWDLGGGAVRASASLSYTQGDELAIRRVGPVYTVYKNGIEISGCTWTDSTDIIARDASHLTCGLYIYAAGGGNCQPIDSWEAKDYGAAPLEEEAAADLTGSGSLSATVTAKYSAPVSLSGSGSLFTTVTAKQPVTANLFSTGQLSATVAIAGEEPPLPDSGKWTSDPNPPMPVRRFGSGWSTGGTSVLTKPSSSWFALLEKVAEHNGNGQLTSAISPHYKIDVDFHSDGELSNYINVHRNASVSFNSFGSLVGEAFEIRNIGTAFFSSSGLLEAKDINDGLTAFVQQQYLANFSGGGILLTNVVGGTIYADGLSAIVWERYGLSVFFDSQGQFIANLGVIVIALANFTSVGTLSTLTPKQIYSQMLALAGNGTLSASAFATYQKLVNLLGSGQLSPELLQKYFMSIGLPGAGALTALLLASYNSPVSSGGVGTITALISQKYTVSLALSGNGTVSALVSQKYAMSLNLSGSGTISALVSQEYAMPLALSGDGSLSATVFGIIDGLSATVEAIGLSPFDPTSLTGLTVWLDASQLAGSEGSSIGSQWDDLSGAGNHGTVYGSPAPVVKTNVLNGKRVVQFTAYAGAIRGDNDFAADATGNDYSIFYIGRMIGPTAARLFGGTYLPHNFLVGYHGGGQDACYAGGWLYSSVAITAYPTAWRIWGYIGTWDGSTALGYFYRDGTLMSSSGVVDSLGQRYNLSGYDATGTQETSDAQVAELIIYNRSLSDTERIQLEDYLSTKWGL